MKKIIMILTTIFIVLFTNLNLVLSEDLNQNVQEQPEINIIRIFLDKKSITMLEGEEVLLSVDYLPNNATNKELIWTSSNNNVVKVENGKVTARNAGKAKITVTNSSKTASAECTVTVNEKPPSEIKVSKIEVDKLSIKLKVGETETVKATVLPSNATNKELIWSVAGKKKPTSRNQVIMVENGKITALGKGTAVVSVMDSSKTIITKINVTVLDNDNVNSEVKITKLNINKPSIIIKKGDVEVLGVTILPSNASNKELIWTSSNEKVATVDNGVVTGLNIGDTVITVTNKDKTVESKSNVKVIDSQVIEIPLKSITISKKEINLYKGNEFLLVASPVPGNSTDNELIWSSTNENVAKVYEGRVVALGIGTTDIIVSNKEGNIQAKCIINVKEIESEEEEIPIDFDFLIILGIGVGVLVVLWLLIKFAKK